MKKQILIGIIAGTFTGIPTQATSKEPETEEKVDKKMKFTPELAIAGGAGMPIGKTQIEFSFDLHGVLSWPIKESPHFEGGVNGGIEFPIPNGAIELKPFGVHIHTEGETVKPAYSFEFIAELEGEKNETALGFTFAYAAKDHFEMRIPFQMGGFSSTIYFEMDEGEKRVGANYTYHASIGPHFQIGPMLDISTQNFGVGLSVRVGHAHAF